VRDSCCLTVAADEVKEGVDSLDAFMSKVEGRLDKSKRLDLTHQLHILKNVPLHLWQT
jgi:hypothetical protein